MWLWHLELTEIKAWFETKTKEFVETKNKNLNRDNEVWLQKYIYTNVHEVFFEENENVENPTYQQEYDTSFGEDLAVDHVNEEEDIPQVPAEKEISPIQEHIEKREQKSRS